MADVFNLPIPQQQLNLPPEYQSLLDNALRQQRMGGAMMGISPTTYLPQQNGPVAPKASMLSAVAAPIQQALGAYLASKGDESANNVRQKFQTDQAGVLKNMVDATGSAPPGSAIPGMYNQDAAINQGLTSQYPMAQQLAQVMMARREAERGAMAKIYSEAGAPNLALSAQQGQYPGPIPEQADPVPRTLRVQTAPGAFTEVPYAINIEPKSGKKQIVFGQGGNSVSVNNPAQTSGVIATQMGEQLKERRAQAMDASGMLSSISFATDALEKGAQSGGGEGFKQAIRKGAEAFGVTLPETASTEQLQMAMGEGLLANARKLAPVTGTDVNVLKGILGDIPTDPTALARALAYAHAGALKAMVGYHDYANTNADQVIPELQPAFRSATAGLDIPAIRGPAGYQLEVARQFQRMGGDITRINDPTGKPFPADSKFNDVNPVIGFPGLQKAAGVATPGAAPTPATPQVDQTGKAFVNGQKYTDKNGNSAIFQDGTWTPVK